MPDQKTAASKENDVTATGVKTATGPDVFKHKLLEQAVTLLNNRNFRSTISAPDEITLSVGVNSHQLCNFVAARNVAISAPSPSSSDFADSLWGKVKLHIDSELKLKAAIAAINDFCDSYLIGFDLDGTLVDTVESFDTTVGELVKRHSGSPLPYDELKNLRAEGGFNNNWDAAVELIKRRGKTLTRKELDPEALEIYFSLAVEKETLIVDLETLKKLAKRHRLFILTGRCQFEFQPVWGGRVGDSFENIYCLDDLPDCKPKPAADSLTKILKLQNATSGVYVGNALDDVWAARAANLQAIAVTTTHSAKELSDAGAQLTYDLPDKVLGAFLI